MKFLPILILFLTLSSSAFCQMQEDVKKHINLLSQEEFAKSGKKIPKKLEGMGFTAFTLMSYYALENVEYYAFSDWRTKGRGDIITWVVVDGKVKDFFKDKPVVKEGI